MERITVILESEVPETATLDRASAAKSRVLVAYFTPAKLPLKHVRVKTECAASTCRYVLAFLQGTTAPEPESLLEALTLAVALRIDTLCHLLYPRLLLKDVPQRQKLAEQLQAVFAA